MGVAEQERLDLAGEDERPFLVVDLADGVVAGSAESGLGQSRGLVARVQAGSGRYGQAGGDQNGQVPLHCRSPQRTTRVPRAAPSDVRAWSDAERYQSRNNSAPGAGGS